MPLTLTHLEDQQVDQPLESPIYLPFTAAKPGIS